MIALFVSLRLRLTRNLFRSSAGFGMVFLIFFSGIGSVVATLLIWRAEPVTLEILGPLLSTALVVGWSLGPIMYGSSDETIDTTRLALYPINPILVTRGVFVASFLSPLALATLGPLIAFGLRAPTVLSKAIGITAGLLTACLAIASSRLVVTAIGAAFRQRNRRDWSTIAAGAGAALLAIAAQLASFFGLSIEVERLRGLSSVLRWTPTGWSGHAQSLALGGSMLLPLAEILLAGWVLTRILAQWAKVLERALTEVESSEVTHNSGGHLMRTSTSSHYLAPIVAKELRYLRRHPRYRVQVVSQSAVLLIGGAPIVRAIANQDPTAVLLGCIPALTVGIAGANLLAPDGGALWAEILATDSLKPIIRGRSLAFAGVGLAGATIITLLTAIYTRGFLYILPALGASVGFALVGSGVGTVISVVSPSPYPDNDSPNPFASSAPGGGCLAGAFTFVGVLFGLVLVIPILAGLGYSRNSNAILAVTTLASPIYGALLWWLTTRFAGRKADKKAPELIALLS